MHATKKYDHAYQGKKQGLNRLKLYTILFNFLWRFENPSNSMHVKCICLDINKIVVVSLIGLYGYMPKPLHGKNYTLVDLPIHGENFKLIFNTVDCCKQI